MVITELYYDRGVTVMWGEYYINATLDYKFEDFFKQINESEKMKIISSEIINNISDICEINIFSIRFNRYSPSHSPILEIYLNTTKDYEKFKRQFESLIDSPHHIEPNNEIMNKFLELSKQYQFNDVYDEELRTSYYDFETIAKDYVLEKASYNLNKLYAFTKIIRGFDGCRSYGGKLYVFFKKERLLQKSLQNGDIVKIKKEAIEFIKRFDKYEYINIENFKLYVRTDTKVGRDYFDVVDFSKFIEV